MSRSSPERRDARAGDENAVAFGRAAAHAATQLVQLREAEALGVLHDHHGGVGHVDANFNDRGGDQHIDFAALKAAHDDLFFVRIEAAVEQADAQAGEGAGAQFLVHFDGGFESRFGRGICLLAALREQLRCFAFARGLARRWAGGSMPAVRIVVAEIQLRLVIFVPSMTG